MKFKKISFIFSFSLLALLTSTSISSKYSSFNDLAIKDKEVIVLFNDGFSLNDFKNEINIYSDEYLIKDTYKGLVNGVLLNVNYSFLDVLPSLKSVDSIHENKAYFINNINKENEYYDPLKIFTTPLENNSLERMNVPSTSNEGEGTLIAILDSSFNLEHESFKDLDPSIDIKLSEEKVDSLVSSLDATNQEDFYYNRKIPFYHDYGGTITNLDNETTKEDDDVFSLNSTHGMHVSSIASANGEFKGVAPSSQLAFMKVFGDSGNTQYCFDSMVLKALNDAYKIGADVVNLSLGADLNEFEDGSASYKAIKKLADEGVIVSLAAGNEGKATWQNSGAYMYDTLDSVEEGTLGSYLGNNGGVGVASANLIDDDEVTPELSVEGNTIGGRDQLSARGDIDNDGISDDPAAILPFTTLIDEDEESAAYEYVLVPGVGAINDIDNETGEKLGNDYENIDVKGKIAVIKRGSNTFSEKIKHAKEKGAIAVIIANQDNLGSLGYFDLTGSSKDELIPAYSISSEDYDILESATKKVLTISRNQISIFSSNGTLADLSMAIEISAPGQNIAGAVSLNSRNQKSNNTYQYLSGTSMAAPNYSGASALILGENDFSTNEERKEYQKTLRAREMSTAQVLKQSNGAMVSPRRQGAGLIDVSNTISSSIYLTGSNKESAKVELKNNEDISSGIIDFNVTIHNEEKLKGNYKATLLVQVPETKYIDGEMSPEFKDIKFQTINDVLVDEYIFDVSLNGEEEQVVNINYELEDSIKNELNSTFENGTYIEGYVLFESENSSLNDLSIPYLGFFGDYSKGDAVEDFTFERDNEKIYQSDVLNNLAEVTGINKPNANFNSLIGVSGTDFENFDVTDVLYNNADPAKIYTPIISEYNESDGKYHLYAGAKGSASTLYIQQFVNRSVESNTITLTNSEGEVVLTDHMFSALHSTGDSNDTYLYKTKATTTLFNEGFIADRAYTIIPLKDEENGYYEDGIYSLKFEYHLSSGYTQVKEYVLEINETVDPLSIDNATLTDDSLILYFDEKMSQVTFASRMASEEVLENGTYKYTLDLTNLSYEELLLNPYVYVSSLRYSFIIGNFNSEFNAILFSTSSGVGKTLELIEEKYPEKENTFDIRIVLRNLGGMPSGYSGDGYLVINLGKGYENSISNAYSSDGNNELNLTKEGNSVFIENVPSHFLLEKGKKAFTMSPTLISLIIAIVIVVILIAVIIPLYLHSKNKKDKSN